jgi:hypothetical protein
MADALNTLGFVSWGLLGSAEDGEGTGETIYILDLGVDVELQEASVEVAMEEFSVEAELTEIVAEVEAENEEVAVEIS